jgi:hypothetical protein
MSNLPIGHLGMHPADPSQALDCAALLWTAPATGDFQFDLNWDYVGGGNGVTVSMTRDVAGSTSLGSPLDEAVWNLSKDSPTASWLQTCSMKAGETMVFEVGPGANNIGYNTTEIALTIETVPEPSTLALAGLGGLSLLLFRRRKN